MPSTPRDPVDAIHGAVARCLSRVGPGLFAVACSGGRDSLVLADAAMHVAGASHVVVVTIDHGLVEGSEQIAARVAAWARARGAAAIVRRVEVVPRVSLEAAARDARYAALAELADELGAVCVLVGHTARDQAETVLMRIVRGTGPAGLAAMAEQRGRYVRPLLAISRSTIDAYATRAGLPTWDDPMNADPRFFRVRVRDAILPALREENPAIDDALVGLARVSSEWLEVIDGRARPFARLPIACATLACEPPAIRKRALALALERASIGYDANHLEQLDAMVTAPPRGEVSIDLPGARLVRSYDTLGLAVVVTGDTLPPAASPHAGYQVRTWLPGDRMRPPSLRGHTRKLSDLFIDAKLPRALRRHARVLVRVADQTIVWADHVGVAFGERAEDLPLPARMEGTF